VFHNISVDISLTLDESDNAKTEPFVQAVREALDDKFDNIITLCGEEINKPGKCEWVLRCKRIF
jgi:NAD dependent epimerase/dehydratase family enzyme